MAAILRLPLLLLTYNVTELSGIATPFANLIPYRNDQPTFVDLDREIDLDLVVDGLRNFAEFGQETTQPFP